MGGGSYRGSYRDSSSSNRGSCWETGLKKVTWDGEARIIGIGSMPGFLEPLGNTMGSNDLEEDTVGVVPEVGNPEGGVFRREGTHEIL